MAISFANQNNHHHHNNMINRNINDDFQTNISLQQSSTLIMENRHRKNNNRIHTLLWRFKMAHLEQEILENRIGFNCNGEFALTHYSIINLILSFIMNLLLLFNLFKYYFNFH